MGLFEKLKQQASEATSGLGLGNYFSSEPQPAETNCQQQMQAAPPPPPAQAQAQQPAPSGNTQIYNPMLENLIEMALADGELTEKEKQVLFKRAQAMGIDLDEFEMVLDAKLYEKKKEMQQTPQHSQAAPKSDKYGDVRKCPGCGAIVESFSTRCPDCGHEFRNINTSTSINTLMQQLYDYDTKNPGGLEIVDMFTGSAMRRVQRKAQIISNFPFPTTKEDMLEFLVMAAPLAKKKGGFFAKMGDAGSANMEHNQLVPAWHAKCEQIIIKARLSMKNDKETLAEIEKYAKELKIK